MLDVRSCLSLVPSDLEEALCLMEEGSAEEIEDLLPATLSRLKGNAKVGEEMIREIVVDIKQVIELLQEVAFCCQGSQGRVKASPFVY